MQSINCRLPDWYDERKQVEGINRFMYLGFKDTGKYTIYENSPPTLQDFVRKYCSSGKINILDHGSGYGRDLPLLMSNPNRKVFALDFNALMIGIILIKNLNNVGRRLHIISGDIFIMPFRNSSFDAVVSSRTLFLCGCWEKVLEAFKELIRVLKVGGYLYLSLMSINNNICKRHLPVANRKIKDITDKVNLTQRINMKLLNICVFTHEEIEYLAKNFGMRIVGKIKEEKDMIIVPGDPIPINGSWQYVTVMKKIKDIN